MGTFIILNHYTNSRISVFDRISFPGGTYSSFEAARGMADVFLPEETRNADGQESVTKADLSFLQMDVVPKYVAGTKARDDWNDYHDVYVVLELKEALP